MKRTARPKLSQAQVRLLRQMDYFPSVRVWLAERRTALVLERLCLVHQWHDGTWSVTADGAEWLKAEEDKNGA